MDLAKNKYGIAFLLIVAIAAVHYFFFYEKCEQPDQMTVALAQLSCAESIDAEAFKAELCKQLHGTEVCDLYIERDGEAAQKLFLSKENECTIAALKKDNKCVDKYEAL